MAIHGAFTHCNIFANGYDLSGLSNMVRVEAIKEVKDRTTFGNSARVRAMAGLGDFSFQAAGFVDMTAGAQDVQFRANYGTNTICGTVMIPSVGKTAVAAGDKCWFSKFTQGQYQTAGAQGDDLMFQLSLQAGALGYPLCFGQVLDPGTTAITIDGNGTGVQVGAIGAGQYAYALVHAVSVSAGDTDDIIIQSAAANDFAGASTRFTFTQVAATGAEFLARLAGPIGDTWWRCVHNVGGVDVSIKTAVVLAIQ